MSSRGEPQSVAPIGLDSAGGLTLTVGLVWTIADWSRHRRSKRTPLRVPGHRPQSARISPVSRQGEPNLSRRVIRLSGESLRRMMPRMSRFPVRVVCHANLRIDLVPARVRELEATIRRRCQESDAQLVDFCVDLGKPKRRPEDYPALNYFRAGKADALLIVCMPSDEPLPRGDLLTSRALSGFPAGWLAVPKLREVGLLPPAIGLRSVAGQRAAALRERSFPCDVIARWLDAEGYAAPNTDPGHWTRGDVLKLLREARSVTPPTLPGEPQGAPAALL